MRPGQRLLALSDPIRTDEEWEITPTTSLSRIRDAIQFRRPPSLRILLSTASVQDDATWSLENAAWCASCCIMTCCAQTVAKLLHVG